MNVLVINGSPRSKGNSDLLCDEFIKGAKENKHVVEKISLKDRKIEYCRACYACFQSGRCIQSDDMEQILLKLKQADVLVLATPTYFMTMSGQMKVFIDRLLPEWQGIDGKEVYIIVTGHDGKEGLKRAGNDLYDIFTYLGNHVHPILWAEGVWKKGEVLYTKAMEQAYQLGKSIEGN